MYLHKVYIDKDTLTKNHKTYANAYMLHQKMWELAGRDKNQRRDFLYRVEYDAYQNIKHIYLLASHRVSPQNNMKLVVSPEYRPKLEEQERLCFKLRANPIVKRKENGKTKEYSLLMDAKQKLKRNEKTYQEKFSLDELIHEIGMKWLTRKGEQHGFAVKEFEIAIDNDREYVIKTPVKNEYMLRTLDFGGILTVVDPERFIEALYQGVGTAKAFGCGLMLVRRA